MAYKLNLPWCGKQLAFDSVMEKVKKVCFSDRVEHLEEKPGIIEFQAFRGSNNEYIIKELVILDLVTYVVYTFFFKPPFSFKKLNSKAKTTNKWLTKHFHHINWVEGFTSYRDLDSIMYHFCNQFNKIYTRGSEKRNWIQMYTTSTVFDTVLDKDFNCCFDSICLYAKDSQHKLSHCALKNVYRLAAFIDQREGSSGGGSGGYKYEETGHTQHEYYSRLRGDNTYTNNSAEDGFPTVPAVSS